MTSPSPTRFSDQIIAPQMPFIIRGSIAHCVRDPFESPDDKAVQYFVDGALFVDAEGTIGGIGDYHSITNHYPEISVLDRTGCLILPGFVDCHTHYPQTLATAAYGEQLLDWLDRYIFPEEARYEDEEHAKRCAEIFFSEMIAQGTTTALIFGAHFEAATNIAFAEAERRGFRAVMGMSLADRHVPEPLMLESSAAISASARLIEHWHGRGNLLYAVTPRFAPSCSELLLQGCSRLLQDYPGVYFQTHANENQEEIKWCRELFPGCPSYVGVYEHYGLLSSKSLVAHCIHCTPEEIDILSRREAAVVHCPSSNAFLGSGILPMARFVKANVRLCLGTDVGAGANFGLLGELNQAYKLQMLLGGDNGGVKLSGAKLLYLATTAGARALGLESQIGNLQAGKKADFLVLDLSADAYFEQRMAYADSVEEMLFTTAMLAGKRMIREVYMSGKRSACSLQNQ
jgi:guanine deaminase